MKVNNVEIANMREDYRSKPFGLEDTNASPFLQFKNWFGEAVNAGIPEANAMTLATCTKDAIPSARIVLLKGFDENGFRFFTNYNGQKSQEIIENPNVALVFCWLELSRQIRIVGQAEKLTFEQSEAYFKSRPKGSQIGAWASPQSTVIDGRSILEEKVLSLNKEYQDADELPCPKHWGGFLVKPRQIEFWQGRTSRLHDRLRYSKKEGNGWLIERLAP